jgi:hypothetical protein
MSVHTPRTVAAGAGGGSDARNAPEPLGEGDEESSPAGGQRAIDRAKRSRSRNSTATYVCVRRRAERPVQGLEEEGAVREAGERVVGGVVGQPLLERLAVRDVEHDSVEPERRTALVVAGLALLDDPPDAAVAVTNRVLDHERLSGAERIFQLAVGALPVAGQDQLVEEHVVAEELLRGVPGQRDDGFAHELVGVRRGRGAAIHRARDVLDQRAESCLALPQLALGPQPFPDVAEADDDPADGLVVEQVARLDLDRDPSTVAVAQSHLERARVLPAVEQLAQGFGREPVVVGVDEVHRVRPGDGSRREPERLDATGGEHELAVPVEEHDGVRRVLDQCPVAGLVDLGVALCFAAGEQRREDPTTVRSMRIVSSSQVRSRTTLSRPTKPRSRPLFISGTATTERIPWRSSSVRSRCQSSSSSETRRMCTEWPRARVSRQRGIPLSSTACCVSISGWMPGAHHSWVFVISVRSSVTEKTYARSTAAASPSNESAWLIVSPTESGSASTKRAATDATAS